jgi:GAF domain-containing protein
MILQGRVMGVFVARTGSDGYTPAHLKILETLADQAALLFNTSQLYTILARRYERLSNYND